MAHVINSNVDISKTTITDVWNEKKGGAFYIFNNSILELSEVTMSKAKAGDGGGCVYAYASSVSFYKVTCD